MGRKGWWKGGSCLVLLFLVLIHGLAVQGDGEVGCLFDKNVCTSPEETCFNDNAFGRCIRPLDALDDGIYRYDLGSEDLEVLGAQLETLVARKYDWSHPYTQCIMQNALYSIRYRVKPHQRLCQDLEELDGETSLMEFINENNPDDEEIRPLAVVNFMPTRGHGYGDFANEMYNPPVSTSFDERRLLSTEDYYDPYAAPENQKPVRHPTLNFDNNEEPLIFEPDESNQFNQHEDELYDLSRKLEEQERQQEAARQTTVFRSRRRPRGEASRTLGDELQDYLVFLKDSPRQEEDEDAEDPEIKMNLHPKNVNRSFERLDSSQLDRSPALEFLRSDGEWNKFRNDEEEEEEEGFDDRDILSASLEGDELSGGSRGAMRDGIFTEGGLVQPLSIYEQEPENIALDDLPAFLLSREFTGFKRPERLDVKKPGPLFSTNNYAFKTQTASPNDQDNELKANEDLRAPLVKKELIAGSDITRLSMGKDSIKSYDNVDMDHVYIQFKEEFHKWSEGEAVVEKVEELLGLKPGELSSTRVGRAEVTFKVNKNSLKMNAMDVVSRLDDIREKLRETMKITIIRAGIGDKTKLPPVLEVTNAEPSMSSTLFAAIVAAGVTAAAAAAVVTLMIARRHAKSRAKLAGLATPDPEASKDYQELCRARMHAKQPADKPESPRLMHLSRESESNRSSTSSWGGEEAASLSNMDISTGHMVLSYMEDHLKNKDRLDQEWSAIGAYEADPSSIAAATDKSNEERHRPGSAFPYDHSRVVLNDLANLNNSDYINASTITDHDPRNPAYIATQGPLPQTSADFWQLVWEQGSVVIVMLTRLTEEGRAMCHRYWPEEGSELYHIYEVHLVSEHIWCDDYLVRSFYLKNLRTGETRTVTQFHFLSWPENGVPQSTKALLEFRRKVNKSYRGRSCPIVVHCSDGAGRTGTYCLIDMVLNRMAKGAKEIDIAAALEHIRDQRPGMVATKQQFEFVLVAVAEEVHAILKALPVVDKSQTTSTSVATTTTTTTTSTSATASGSEH